MIRGRIIKSMIFSSWNIPLIRGRNMIWFFLCKNFSAKLKDKINKLFEWLFKWKLILMHFKIHMHGWNKQKHKFKSRLIVSLWGISSASSLESIFLSHKATWGIDCGIGEGSSKGALACSGFLRGDCSLAWTPIGESHSKTRVVLSIPLKELLGP